MEFSSVPIIVLCCYIIGEIYKIVFKNKKVKKTLKKGVDDLKNR